MNSHHPLPDYVSDPSVAVRNIATRAVICLPPSETISRAAQIMARQHISSIIVTDAQDQPVGIVTERNLLHALQTGIPPQDSLKNVMSTPVWTILESTPCLEAYQSCMERGFRHLVLTKDDGRLSGVVSLADFRHHLNLSTLAGRRKVTSTAKRAALTLPPESLLKQALELMHAQQKSCVIVVQAEIPVGIITERDVVHFFATSSNPAEVTLGEVMTSPVLTVSNESSISHAAERMLNHEVRHLVVVDDSGRMAGLLCESDLTQVMISGFSDERDNFGENFLRTLIDTLPDLIWLKDAEGKYLACNSRFERFFGARECDIVGKSDYDFVPHELADIFRNYDRKVIESGHSSTNEEWVQYADDQHTELLETIKTPMRDRGGKTIGVLGIARDITLRKRLEYAQNFVSQKGWAEGVEKFLDALAHYLGDSLGVDYVIIDRLTDNPEYAETIALYAKGEIASNIRYHLPGTPCENVFKGEYCCYADGVQQRFPSDEFLVNLEVESYAGIPLWGTDGRAIGLIAVLDSKPMQNEYLVEQLLKIVASRAAAELERDAALLALRGCKKFCVNGHLAGDCRPLERSRNDRSKSTTRRTDRQPAVWL